MANKEMSEKESTSLLELLSRSGDIGEHSPCPFCRHRGKTSCPRGNVQKLGPCADYEAKHHSPQKSDAAIIDYLARDPKAESIPTAIAA